MYISVIFVILPHYGSSVTQAQLADSKLLLYGRNNVDCSEGTQNVKPIGSLLMLKFLFIVSIGNVLLLVFCCGFLCGGFFVYFH